MSDTPSARRHARPVRRGAVLAIATLLVGLIGLPATTTASASQVEVRGERHERTVLARVNRVRARHDLPRLRVLPCVDVLAERRAVRPLRPARAARIDARRLRRSCDRPLDLAASRRGPARLVARAWLGRPRTRSVLLAPEARFVGVAAVPERGRWRVTLLVAGPRLSAPDSAPADEGGTTTEAPADDTAMDELELAVLDRTNRRRTNHGLAPLLPSSCAADFAGDHSATMAESGTFAHASLSDLQDSCGGTRLAENIATGSGTTVTARGLVQLWMASPGHRANILDPGLTHLGVGIAVDAGSGRWYATQDFLGSP